MDGQVGGYPTKFLEQIVRLNKSLKQKKECINTLRYLVRRTSNKVVLSNQHKRRKRQFNFVAILSLE